MLRLRVKKHWKKISPNDRESLKAVVLQAFMQETEHSVQHSLSQLCALMVKHETPDRWPALLQLLNQATKSGNAHDRQTQMRSMIPSLITAFKPLIKSNQDQASEAMEVFNELMESEVSIIVPHISAIVSFCLEVGTDTTLNASLRVKALSCLTFLIKLKSKVVIKQKLLNPILQSIFPVLTAAPPPGEQDPEDDEDKDCDGEDEDSPKHVAAQIIDTMALHMPPEKLFQQLMPLTQAALSNENPYQRKGGLMCLAVLAEGCADYIRTKMLSSVLQTVCRNLSDSNQVVRSAALFALGQFSEHLQPDISKYCDELMPLLLRYLSSLSLNQAKIVHVTKAFYALENFMENLGAGIEPYLPTVMETMLSTLNNAENIRIKELAVSAIGAIANAAKELLVPYFPPIIESLKGFLTTTSDEMRSLQTQSLDTLSVLVRTVGKDVFSPLAAECVQLGLNLANIDDPDLRRCTYSLYSAVSTISPESLTPHLEVITNVMLLALKSNEGITAHVEEDKTFVLLDDEDDDDEEGEVGEKDLSDFLEDDTEPEVQEASRFTVENAYIDEKEDACDSLGEIAFNTGEAFQPFLESCFQQVYEMKDFAHEDVRKAAMGAMGQFCNAQHKVWKQNPTDVNHQAVQKLLELVMPCLLKAVKTDEERQVVMGVLDTINHVIKSCKEEVFRNPTRLKEICNTINDVLKKKTTCQDCGCDDVDDEDQQAEYDAMLQEYAGEGIPLVAAAVPADAFAPFLNDLLPLIMSKAKSSCPVAERSFSVGTIGELLSALVKAPGGRGLAGRLSNRLLPVLVAGVKDSDDEVRNNSVYALGCLAEAAGPIVASDSGHSGPAPETLAQQHSADFHTAVTALPGEQQAKLSAAISS
ncbi:hypothetical protein WMY93_030009 [Mugilogobius chulae]|uniref:Importin N-terminal domain-containing protein n=1 Tax=Mugilogobius chulae TaxID=88201 RepID=A0AAW0MQ47_9GOBI